MDVGLQFKKKNFVDLVYDESLVRVIKVKVTSSIDIDILLVLPNQQFKTQRLNLQ